MKESLSKLSLSLMVAAVGVLVSQSARAQISDGVVKLGVLNPENAPPGGEYRLRC